MKAKIFGIVATLLVIAIYAGSCKKDGVEPPVKQEVNFSFVEKTMKGNTLKSTDGDEVATSVLITITKSNGDPVLINGEPAYIDKVLQLYDFGSSTISESIALEIGDYKLTKFVVLENTTALYATPLEGSANANLVSYPLPISFTVTKDLVTKVVPEVLAINQSTPADFGYASFDFQIVETIFFRLCAQIFNSTAANWELTSADVSIIGTTGTNTTSVYTGTIGAVTSDITVNGTYDSYTINVSKDGNSVVKIVSKAELLTYSSTPLIFLLNGTVTDCSGNVYHTVQIGTQVWMVENLKTTCYRDGDPIPNVTDNAAWASLTTGAYCWYNNDIANKTPFGALYNWYAIDPASNGNNNIAPEGWHVPTDAEWTILTTYLGGDDVAGGKMKETGTTHWSAPNYATNESGFTAMPTGYRVDGSYNDFDTNGWYWSSTQYNTSEAWTIDLDSSASFCWCLNFYKQNGYAVRLVKD